MIPLLFSLKIVHVIAAAVWLGGGLTAPSDLRRTLTLGQPHVGVLMPRLKTIARLMNWSALLTFVSGAVLIAVVGGAVPHRIHLGVALSLAAVAVGKWMIRPVLGEIARAIQSPLEAEQIDRIMVRFWTVNGAEHALRLAVLVLMVYPFDF